MRIGIFDLMNVFWTLAGARSKGEGYSGLALAVLRHCRGLADRLGFGASLFAADGPQGRSWRRALFDGYKAGRERHDPVAVAQLGLLSEALAGAGFPVLRERVEFRECEACAAKPGTPDLCAECLARREHGEWLEGDDLALSAALKALSARLEPAVVSTDWDLAQVLGHPGVRLFTHRGDEQTAALVEKEFGVGPVKLAELRALAGGEGWKAFPGSLIGATVGIGEKGAADLLRAFGSASTAMAFALNGQDAAFSEKSIPKRVPKLLKAGGQAALDRALRCAALRGDAPVPDEFDVGDWEEAEGLLKAAEARLPPVEDPAPEPNIDIPGDRSPAADRPKFDDYVKASTADLKPFRAAAHAQLGPLGARGGRVTREGTDHDPDDHGGTPHDDPDPVLDAYLAGKFVEHDDLRADLPPGHPDRLSEAFKRAELRQGDVDAALAGAEEVDTPDPRLRGETFKQAGVRMVAERAAAEVTPLPESVALPRLAPEPEVEDPALVAERKAAAAERRVASGEVDPGDPYEKLAVRLAKEAAARGVVTPDECRAEGDRVCAALEPRTELVVLTAEEFHALAPLPALLAAGVLTPPERGYEAHVRDLAAALAEGALRPAALDSVFVGHVSRMAARGLAALVDLAAAIQVGGERDFAGDKLAFAEQLKGLHLAPIAGVGKPLARRSP